MDFLLTNWRDLLTVTGVVITLLAALVAVISAINATSAKEAAKIAAKEAADRVSSYTYQQRLSALRASLEKCRVHCDSKNWHDLRTECRNIRDGLTELRPYFDLDPDSKRLSNSCRTRAALLESDVKEFLRHTSFEGESRVSEDQLTQVVDALTDDIIWLHSKSHEIVVKKAGQTHERKP